MKALVTGGAGFIGSHIVDALIGRGDTVAVVDCLINGKREFVHKEARFFLLDIRSPKFEGIVLKFKPDVIYHLAAQIDVRLSVVDPAFDAEVNIMASIRVLEAARKAGTKKIIFSSSGGAIYGEGGKKFPTSENELVHPLSPYGVSKLACEHYMHCYRHVHGLSYAALRYANVYGPRQGAGGEAGVVPIFARRLLHNDQVVVNGDGGQTRDFVYVDDVVRANLKALPPRVHGIFNIGTGREITVNELFRKIKKLTGATVEAAYGPAKDGEVYRSALACARAKRTFGWIPKTDLDEGLRKTVEWFRSASFQTK